ncbi:unnamed protein product [Nippostrongylus brasiliensis]|uniref:Histone deacetylase n=1 Tax=Nippostrongylus brasiliensis TaxID=27835 RepID=A0A0N4Y374_NIPBR|nr:unnamed protein product [Nippostrongylus brasiliensis]
MLGRIQFGPRLECFGDSSGPPFTIVSPEKKLLAAKRGQFTIFDDEPVEIPPSHPLGREIIEYEIYDYLETFTLSELSELRLVDEKTTV